MIDLHLHLDGSLTKDDLRKIAKLQDIDFDEKKPLSVGIDCKSLNDYLECFDYPLSLLQRKDAIELAMYSLVINQAKQGLIYIEVRFAPQLHSRRGLTQEEVTKAAIMGLKRALDLHPSIDANIILCAMRGANNQEENLETARLVKKYLDQKVVLLDLAGAEALFKTDTFEYLFSYAQSLGIPFTIHAGEADGASSVEKALSFGAIRIGHGVRTIEDGALLKKAARDSIYFEFCPSSNLQTKAFKSIVDFPLRKFMEAGAKVTINTDNTTVSLTTIIDEYRLLYKAFDLSLDEVNTLLINACYAAMVDDTTREKLVSKVNANIISFYKNITN